MECNLCKRPVPQGAGFCPNCGNKLTAAPVPKQKKKKNAAPLVGILLGAAIVIGLLILAVSLFSGGQGPLLQVLAASRKTLEAGSFTITFTVEADNTESSGTAQVVVDTKAQELTVYSEMEQNGEARLAGIYEGRSLVYMDDYGYTQDMEDGLEALFDAYEEVTEDFDRDQFVEDFLEAFFDVEDMDDYVDSDVMEECLNTYIDHLNDKKWLQKNLGYTKESEGGVAYHSFNINLYDLLVTTIEEFEEVFEDSDQYDIILELLEDNEDNFDFECRLTMGIRGGKLVAFTFEMDEGIAQFTFSDFGKTKVDTDTLEELLEEIETSGPWFLTPIYNTLNAGSFTLELCMEDEYNEIEGTAQVELSPTRKELTFLADLEGDGEPVIIAAYDGKIISSAQGYTEYRDVSESMNAAFDAYERARTSELRIQEIVDFLLGHGSYTVLTDGMDMDLADKCRARLFAQLADPEWMEDHLGYGTSSNRSSCHFHFDLGDFLIACMEEYEDAFPDHSDYIDIIRELEYFDDYEIYVSLSVAGGKLQSVELELSLDYDYFYAEFFFSDYGSAKVDPKVLGDLLVEAGIR